MLTQRRRAVVDAVFDLGSGSVAEVLCVQQLKLCDPHTVSDDGEL